MSPELELIQAELIEWLDAERLKDKPPQVVDFARLHSEMVEWVNFANPLSLQERMDALDSMLESEGKPRFNWTGKTT